MKKKIMAWALALAMVISVMSGWQSDAVTYAAGSTRTTTALECLPKTGWQAWANDCQNNTETVNAQGQLGEGNAQCLVDGNVNSNWHGVWSANNNSVQKPASDNYIITFNLGKKTRFTSFSFLPRKESSDANATAGAFKDYELYIANTDTKNENDFVTNHDNGNTHTYRTLKVDNEQWHKVSEGTFPHDTTHPKERVYVNLDEMVSANHVKLVLKGQQQGGKSYYSAAEFDLHTEKYPETEVPEEKPVQPTEPGENRNLARDSGVTVCAALKDGTQFNQMRQSVLLIECMMVI